MANTGEVLMSTRELGCRRTNQQAERYLSKVLGQLDVEKHLVSTLPSGSVTGVTFFPYL